MGWEAWGEEGDCLGGIAPPSVTQAWSPGIWRVFVLRAHWQEGRWGCWGSKWMPGWEVSRVYPSHFPLQAGRQCLRSPGCLRFRSSLVCTAPWASRRDLSWPPCVSFLVFDTKTNTMVPTPKDQLETTVLLHPFLIHSINLNLVYIWIILCMRKVETYFSRGLLQQMAGLLCMLETGGCIWRHQRLLWLKKFNAEGKWLQLTWRLGTEISVSKRWSNCSPWGFFCGWGGTWCNFNFYLNVSAFNLTWIQKGENYP